VRIVCWFLRRASARYSRMFYCDKIGVHGRLAYLIVCQLKHDMEVDAPGIKRAVGA
jgi:hypothetical protein